MPVSFHEYYFYSLCLKAELSIIAVRQDSKQDIKGKSIKNFDFIINTNKKVFLIDIKGSSRIAGDTKVSRDDIDGMKALKKLYGKNICPLFVFFWTDNKLKEKKTLNGIELISRVKIKAIEVGKYKGVLQKGWNGKYFRCNRKQLKDIWMIIPEFKKLIF